MAPPNWRLNPITWAPTFDKLVWQYGRERAEAIMDGKDEAANADLAAWHRVTDLADRRAEERRG